VDLAATDLRQRILEDKKIAKQFRSELDELVNGLPDQQTVAEKVRRLAKITAEVSDVAGPAIGLGAHFVG
jgi:hypothetical protein